MVDLIGAYTAWQVLGAFALGFVVGFVLCACIDK